MRLKESLAAATNVIVIGLVAFTFLRPSGAIGGTVVQWQRDRHRQQIVSREWATIADARRIDSARTGAVAMVEFADYECPACRRQYSTYEAVLNGSNSVGVAFRHRPLPIHPHAEGAARTAICAEKQGKFLAMHERLFSTDAWLADTNWMREAIAVGVPDTAKFSACRSSKETTARLHADAALADTLDIHATPTFVAAKETHVGLLPDTMFVQRLARRTQ